MPSPQKRALPKLDFNVTNGCNYRCFHCCFKSGREKMGKFSCAKIKKVLTLFTELGGWRIDITGGEPETRPDLPKILRIAKELKLKTELVTNGSLLTREKLRHYKDLGLDGIAISLDGPTHKLYEKIRRQKETTFRKVLENIAASAESGFYTKVNTVVFNCNLASLKNIGKLAIALGANEHGFYFFSPIGSGQKRSEEVVNPKNWLAVIREELSELGSKIKISLETPVIETEMIREKKLDTSCFLDHPWHLQILPNGFVYPCAIMAAAHRPLENLNEVSLRKIWEDPNLWNGSFYNQNVLPLFQKFSGCVDYPAVHRLVQSGEYQFVCLCRKFSLEDLL
jgi:MoaA/NifB/PqqE/SkfB family radical SAM enzyme